MSLAALLSYMIQAILGLVVTRCLIVWSYRILAHPLHTYPGPTLAKFSDLYGAYYAYHRRLHWTTYEDHKKYGSVFRQGPNKLVFNSVAAIRDIYSNERLVKSRSYIMARYVPSIANVFNVIDPKTHRVKRRIIGQGLNERAMRKFEPVLEHAINVFLRQLHEASRTDAVVDLSELSQRLSYDVAVELGFGYNLGMQTSDDNRWLLHGVSRSNWRANIYMQWPTLKKLKLGELALPFLLPTVLRYRNLTQEMVRSRLAQSVDAKPDLFASISEYKDPQTNEGLTPSEIWAEAVFLLPAAGDTTATLMAGAMFHLSRNPNCYGRLAEEIRDTFASGAEICNGPKLLKCEYLRAAIDETLRLSPPVGTTLWREVPSDGNRTPVVVDGHVVPPGTQLGVNLYTIHHNEAYFPDPFEFKPSRWLDEDMPPEEKKLMRDAFVPFSLGYRGCAGKPMAYLESSLMLAKTMWYFDFIVAPGALKEGTVFRAEDVFSSVHNGPRLNFYPRGDTWQDIPTDWNRMVRSENSRIPPRGESGS